MAISRLPSLSAELIQQLDSEFPHRCLAPGQSVEDAHRYAGKRELIDFLLRLLARDDDPSKPLIRR